MSPDEIVQRAEHARQLLEDPMVVEALDLIEREIVEQWEACPLRDKEGKEELWKLMKTAKKFRGVLQGAIESGKVVTLRAQQSLKERVFSMAR